MKLCSSSSWKARSHQQIAYTDRTLRIASAERDPIRPWKHDPIRPWEHDPIRTYATTSLRSDPLLRGETPDLFNHELVFSDPQFMDPATRVHNCHIDHFFLIARSDPIFSGFAPRVIAIRLTESAINSPEIGIFGIFWQYWVLIPPLLSYHYFLSVLFRDYWEKS